MPRKPSRIVNIRVLRGEPTDGTGKVCIHLFVKDDAGIFVEPHALHPVYKDGEPVKQQVEAKSTRGKLACDPKRDPAPVTRGGVTTITPRTDDPQAVTCPACMASVEYAQIMARLGAA